MNGPPSCKRISEECRWEQPIRKRGHASSNRCEVRVNRLARAFPVPGFAVVPQRQRVIIRTPVPSPAVTRSWISHAGIGCIKISAKRVRIFAGIFARIFPRIFPETFSDARNPRFRAQHAQDSRFRSLERSGANGERAGIEKAAIPICIQGHDFQPWMPW